MEKHYGIREILCATVLTFGLGYVSQAEARTPYPGLPPTTEESDNGRGTISPMDEISYVYCEDDSDRPRPPRDPNGIPIKRVIEES